MAIVNLLLKPLTCFVLYRLYQDRSGLANFPSISISGECCSPDFVGLIIVIL